MGAGRRFGDGRAPREALGVGAFADEEGSTTLAAAVAVLVSLALVFGLANVQWAASRAADVQAVADAGALAGANAVAAYVTVAQLLDAVVLSMGLVGVLVLAIGLVLCALPVVGAAGPPVVDAARSVFSARERLARSAAAGLEKLEKMVPYLVAANSFAAVRANSSPEGAYVGVAVPYPADGSSDFGPLDADDVSEKIDELEGKGDEVEELTGRADEAKTAADAALLRGWQADCGGSPSMRERAQSLARLEGALNPSYPSVAGWDFGVAVRRARAYYRQRLAAEAPADPSPAEQARSAARAAFYRYALGEVEASSYEELADGTVACDLRDLPADTQDVRGTGLYTDAAWPCTQEAAGPTLHGYAGCPGATGPSLGTGSVADLEAGALAECPVCQFTVVDLGRAPAASTSIENGFEHHWRDVVEASRDYRAAREEQARLEEEARAAAEEARDLYEEALRRLSVTRVSLSPPGRYGCVCFVFDGRSHETPRGLANALSPGGALPARVAVSGAVLARDEAAEGNTVLSGFFDGLVSRGGAVGGASSVLDAVAAVWGDLLLSYGNGFEALESGMDDAFGKLSDLGLGRVASWLEGALRDAVGLVGLQPADMSMKKPVLANSSDVMARSGSDARAVLNALSTGAAHASPGLDGLLSALGVSLQSYYGTDKVVVADLPVPGTDISIPLEVDLAWLAGLGEAS